MDAKKQRKANFSDVEVEVLVDAVGTSYKVLYGKFSPCLTNNMKTMAWESVTEKQVDFIIGDHEDNQYLDQKYHFTVYVVMCQSIIYGFFINDYLSLSVLWICALRILEFNSYCNHNSEYQLTINTYTEHIVFLNNQRFHGKKMTVVTHILHYNYEIMKFICLDQLQIFLICKPIVSG